MHGRPDKMIQTFQYIPSLDLLAAAGDQINEVDLYEVDWSFS